MGQGRGECCGSCPSRDGEGLVDLTCTSCHVLSLDTAYVVVMDAPTAASGAAAAGVSTAVTAASAENSGR